MNTRELRTAANVRGMEGDVAIGEMLRGAADCIDRMRAALAFYANEANWEGSWDGPKIAAVVTDGGRKARDAITFAPVASDVVGQSPLPPPIVRTPMRDGDEFVCGETDGGGGLVVRKQPGGRIALIAIADMAPVVREGMPSPRVTVMVNSAAPAFRGLASVLCVEAGCAEPAKAESQPKATADYPGQLRPVVSAFAAVMESKLRKRDGNEPERYLKVVPPALWRGLRQHVEKAIERAEAGYGKAGDWADVANYAMMLAHHTAGGADTWPLVPIELRCPQCCQIVAAGFASESFSPERCPHCGLGFAVSESAPPYQVPAGTPLESPKIAAHPPNCSEDRQPAPNPV